MLTVEKFLGYFELEKSLIVVCWIDIIFGILLGIFAIFIYAILMIKSCDQEMREMLQRMEIEDCEATLKVATTMFTIFLALLLFIIFVNYLLIKGTKTRNHKLILSGLIVAPIAIICQAISYILSGKLILIISGVFIFICGVYFWICLYSVYVRFRDEKKNFNNVQYQQP